MRSCIDGCPPALKRLELARGLSIGLLDDAALQLVRRGQSPVLGRPRIFELRRFVVLGARAR